MKEEDGFREGPFYCSNCNKVGDNEFNQCVHGNRSITKCCICGRFIPEIPKNTAQALKLINLMIENPHLPVIPMVNYGLRPDDNHQYWTGSIGDIKKGIYFDTGDTILSDMDDIENYFSEQFEDDCDGIPEEEFDKLIQEEIKKADIKEVIYVYIELPEAI
jgi:hypothetical protein